MILFGNILLAVALFAFVLVTNLTYFYKSTSGDAAVGWAWSVIMGIAVFSICLTVVAIIVHSKGGFQWVLPQSNSRTFVILLAGLAMLIGNGFYMIQEYPNEVLPFLRPVTRVFGVLFPLSLLAGLAVLLNLGVEKAPVLAYKVPLVGGLLFSLIALGVLFLRSVRQSANVQMAASARDNKIHQDHLNQIDTTSLEDIVFLFVLTDANHDIVVRNRAVTKVRSRPDWEEELIRRLKNDWAPEAFTFLASNDVDHPEQFLEPIKEGVFIQAKLIREAIKECRGDYDLYPDRFTWEVERVLRTVTKYGRMGADYRAGVQAMRAALDEPTEFTKPKLKAVQMLDAWLQEH